VGATDGGRWPGAHPSFAGSPLSEGIIAPDMWAGEGAPGNDADVDCENLVRSDWAALRERAVKHGARNSLLIALMPTATTSHIMGSAAEATEPYSSLLFKRKTLAGEFVVVNRMLVDELDRRGLWGPAMKEAIIEAEGSVARLDAVPADVRALFQTAWDVKQSVVLRHARARSPYVCQSQSTNIFMEAPTRERVVKMHLYGWRLKLKSGVYYTRTKPAATAQRFTIAPKAATPVVVQEEEEHVCLACQS
jgi:ribonucleotide reductase alpha subunit